MKESQNKMLEQNKINKQIKKIEWEPQQQIRGRIKEYKNKVPTKK